MQPHGTRTHYTYATPDIGFSQHYCSATSGLEVQARGYKTGIVIHCNGGKKKNTNLHPINHRSKFTRTGSCQGNPESQQTSEILQFKHYSFLFVSSEQSFKYSIHKTKLNFKWHRYLSDLSTTIYVDLFTYYFKKN